MTSPLDEIPLPTGWEKKFDSASSRTYYIDHARHATQWDDPRLHHPSIWHESQRHMLQRMVIIFKDAPEGALRQALITTRFVESDAVNHVANLGYKKSATIVFGQPSANSSVPTVGSAAARSLPPSSPKQLSPATVANGEFPTVKQAATRRTSSPKPRSSTISPKGTRTGSTMERSRRAGADPFTLMTMKSRFPETGEEIIVDVLNQCGQNVDLATRELNNMGYAGRQRATERSVDQDLKSDELQKEKKRKVKEDRDQTLRQLKNEFESFLDADIANAFESCAHDLYETRSALRHREADLRSQALTTTEATAVPVVTVHEELTSTAIGVMTMMDERRRSGSADPSANILKETATTKPSPKPRTSNMKPPKKDAVASAHEAVSRSTGATPLHHAGAAWVSLAKGPNPALRHGSDPNLRYGITRALGPDPSLRRGPNPELRQFTAGQRTPFLAVQ